MIFYPVVFFVLCWQCTGGENIENISIESLLDQVAIPTKIINEFLQKPIKTSPSKKYSLNERVESSTIHYENSNGFVPLIVSTQPYEVKQKRRNLTRHVIETINGTKSQKPNAVENDPLFSTEARIFFNLPNPSDNRRSFNVDNTQDEFELLKVSNGTPAVANYNTFYDRSRDSIKSGNSDSSYKRPLRNKDRERGKRIQNYLGNYDATNVNSGQYVQSESDDKTKNVYQPEKTRNNYKQDTSTNYRSQKTSTLPKTNYASITTSKPSTKSYASQTEKNEDSKFKSPIMVAPSEYKVDMKFNGQTVQSVVSTSSPYNIMKDEMDISEPENETSERYSNNDGTNRNYESADSRDFSEENLDYMDEMEKPRRVQKTSRRRPHHFDSSRKLPKEHRETYDDAYDDHGRRRPNTRSKSRYRQKPKPVQIVTEDDQYDNEGDNVDENGDSNNQQNFNEGNTWNQVTPNVEISHSNGYEINQIEKPKLHLVPVNILSNFDHATALDNSQGFDISNAMFTGFVQREPMVSTAAPLMSSTPNYIDQNLIPSSTAKPPLAMSTVPDVIVGQSSFQNPVQAVLMPNKLHQNMFNQYMQSTVSPAVFAVTPRPEFTASSTPAPSFQQMLNQVQASFPMNQQFVTAQPTRQSFTNLLQPVQSNNEIYVNNNGLQGQSSYQFQNIQSTTNRPNSDRSESSQKKKFNGNNGQFLASASLSVGHRHSNKGSSSSSSNKKHHNNEDDYNYSTQNTQRTISSQNLNTFVQPTMVPAILHTGNYLISNQNPQLVQNPLFLSNAQQSALNSMKQLQYDIQNNRYQFINGIDNIGGASSVNQLVQKAQLPILGPKNVEIINPNLNANAYAINQIPATIVTTPIPIFTTTGFITPKQSFSTTTQETPVSVQNFVDSLTEIGSKKPNIYRKLNINSLINLQGADRPMYNPINFVPNYDLIKSQSILNNNVVPNDLFTQQNLNLVPLVPGGNFYKHSQGAQVDLANKPKLSSDLEKYAEEMFKESLRTIYNSHKWNSEARPVNISLVDSSDLAKLRNELLRMKNNLRDSRGPKDIEAHYTENKIRTAKPGSDYKRPDSSGESFKKGPPHHHHHHHPHHHHHHNHKPKINDYLTPPKIHSFISKSPFHDKPPPKKRPGHKRPHSHHESRPRPRQGISTNPKPIGSEAQASSIVDYKYPLQVMHHEKNHYSQPDFRGSQPYNYPSLTTAYPENDSYKSSAEYKSSERDFYDINHPRTHNLMGLLMKNKQLPQGILQENLYNDRQIGQYFEDENRRTQSQAYEDAFKSFQQKSDRQTRPIPVTRIVRRDYTNPHHKV